MVKEKGWTNKEISSLLHEKHVCLKTKTLNMKGHGRIPLLKTYKDLFSIDAKIFFVLG